TLAGVSAVKPFGTSSIANPGPHGLTEIIYAYTSQAGNNGSAFGGLNGNTLWYNVSGGLTMLIGRFLMIIPMLAIAGNLAKKKYKAIWEWKIIRRAILDAVLKLNPRTMMANPVMFVVEIGSVITTVLLFKGGSAFKFNLQITLWLWFTVVFANFAEAMAEGRG